MNQEFQPKAEKPLLDRGEIFGKELPTASRTNRILAYLIDALVFTGVNVLVIALIAGLTSLIYYINEDIGLIITSIVTVLGVLYYLFGFLLLVAYFLWQENKTGSSIGKRVFNLKVIDLEGNKPSFNTLLGRNAARLIPFEVFLVLGNKKEALHDLISNTRVVEDLVKPENKR